jgi:Zn-dependent protease with chaperone function
MADVAAPYPPAPANMPPDITKPTTSYRVRVLVVLTSLFLFALLYLGLIAGAAYFCYWSFASLGPPPENYTGLNTLREASRTADRLFLKYNNALEQWRDNRMDAGRFVQVLDGELLPEWRAQRWRLAGVKGLPREEQRLVEQYDTVFQLQQESWELLVKAVRTNDPRLGEESKQKMDQSESLARAFSAEADRYYQSRAQNRRSDKSDGGIIIAGILSGLLCLFLVKGFFKWRRADRAQRLEVTEKDQPVLFAFIRRLCRDTGAPLPHRVYLTPEVNAAVFYHESLLSLFLPTPKNLVVGLGLVNQLNLSEFKAVLAHEFGHFSQNSMKLGSYVYVSNRVIADLVFGRDWLDDMVSHLRGVDLRIAIFAWAFSGVLWLLRKALQGLFRVINFANSSLSRQMEFNADLMAVSVTGSDALVHGLARLDLATDALGQAWNDVTVAADHQLFTRDLFYHQTRAVEYLRVLRKDPHLGEPPALPNDPRTMTRVFQPEDTSVPRMWATHPTSHDREVNAKRHYVRSPLDERSPWILFQDAPVVREKVTRQVYKTAGRTEQLTLEAPEVVQAFIDEEHAETTYHPRYHGLYDQRYLTPGDLDELVRNASSEFAGAEELAAAHARLWADEVKTRMEAHQARQEDYRRVAPLAHGAVELTGKDFSFRGARHRAGDAGQLLEQVKKELDQDFDWMAWLDRQAFLVHLTMARQIGEEVREELEGRYRFHLAVQEIHGELSYHNQRVREMLGEISGRRELTSEVFHGVLDVLEAAHNSLGRLLDAAGRLRLPRLKNVTPGDPLGTYLLNKPLIYMLNRHANRLNGEWIGEFLEQLGEVIGRAKRIHFKSLGGILALQEKLAEQWTASGRGNLQPVEVESKSTAS